MTLCKSCYSFLSHRHIKARQDYHIQSTRLSRIQGCNFCAFLRLLFPNKACNHQSLGTEASSTLCKSCSDIDVKFGVRFSLYNDNDFDGSIERHSPWEVWEIANGEEEVEYPWPGPKFDLSFTPNSRMLHVRTGLDYCCRLIIFSLDKTQIWN